MQNSRKCSPNVRGEWSVSGGARENVVSRKLEVNGCNPKANNGVSVVGRNL